MLWHNLRKKDRVRNFILPRKPIVHGIWLPAGECLCIKMAEKYNLIKNSKKIILVEKEKHIYDKMVKNMPKHLNVSPFFGELEKLRLNCKIDYAYLDFLGGLKRSVCEWVSQVLNDHIAVGATIAITQTYNRRNNKTILEQQHRLYGEEGRLIRYYYKKPKENIQRILLLIHRIFYSWDFEIDTMDDNLAVPHYQDTQTSILVFKLVNFKRCQVQKFEPFSQSNE